MKRYGILNSEITKVLTDLGHTDMIVIADAGLPIPIGVKKIDLAIKPGSPAFKEVLEAVADDMVIEKVIMACEIEESNPQTAQFLKETFIDTPQMKVTHEEFKKLTQQAKAIIRTGEITPYANCILQSGVFF
ncbi:D-ribose pyranase [Neobacillus thermocopriae]|uniref:D-ribose pyranase n=1 Tax=Neobacillus thermocopriae TaxID=1215031 RepID=A0A6B3TU89_9BACI|nr:D-ribose pyranase [Neobacillus thermocopriae]MED3624476.1 D-ribose pyranase [Neobacillus thermocopriae]MED3715362.1 D-ribose pyranase [Neobacillus thermocopriae]NEX79561.1 D-ribose pyranase [Neobacillus thermocopriae]